MPWGQRIAAYRAKHGFKQNQLAEMLDVDERNIRRWENGETRPNAKFIPRIQSFLVAAGEEHLVNKKSLYCNGGICIFALSITNGSGAVQGLSVAQNVGPSQSPACAGFCHFVHEEVVARFSLAISDVHVKRFRAQFQVPQLGKPVLATVEYVFHRDFEAPVVVAECRVRALGKDADLVEHFEAERTAPEQT